MNWGRIQQVKVAFNNTFESDGLLMATVLAPAARTIQVTF